jgi:short subunit dehydrogenase-like uncharacterized protein
MLVECGLSLALESEKLTCPGGVYTPAACMGDVLLNRLQLTGTHFAVEVCEKAVQGNIHTQLLP